MKYGYVEIGREERLDKVKKAISERRQLKKDLEKRSGELKAQAAMVRHRDPVKARRLEHQGIALADEAYRISKENKRSMTSTQSRRSAAMAKLTLEMDGKNR